MSRGDYLRAVRIVAAMRVNAEIAPNITERRARNAKALLVSGAFITLFSEGKEEFNPMIFRQHIESEVIHEMKARNVPGWGKLIVSR